MTFCLKRITCILSWFTVRGTLGKRSAWCAALLILSRWININRQKLHVSRLSSLMLHLTAVEWSSKSCRQANNCDEDKKKKILSHITSVEYCFLQYRGQTFSRNSLKIAVDGTTKCSVYSITCHVTCEQHDEDGCLNAKLSPNYNIQWWIHGSDTCVACYARSNKTLNCWIRV